MPLACLASAIWSSFKAGLFIWIPALVIYSFQPPKSGPLSVQDIVYFVASGGIAAILSAKWILDFDKKIHAK